MTAKWIGAALIICACGGFGFYLTKAQKREEKALQELKDILNDITSELSCRLTPLPALCHKISADRKGSLRRVFGTFASELDKQLSVDPGACMAITLNKFPDIPETTLKLIQRLGETFGRFDLESQLKAFDGIQEECDRCLKRLRENKNVRFRTYQTLGLCAGAALAILFI